MAKTTKTYYLSDEVIKSLEHHAEQDDRDVSPFLDRLLKKALYELNCEEGFQADSDADDARMEGI